MQVLEIGTVAAAAGGIGLLARLLDLDDVGAPIGELAHRSRPGAMGGQIENGKSVEGQSGHLSLPMSVVAAMLQKCAASIALPFKCPGTNRDPEALAVKDGSSPAMPTSF